MSSPEEEVEDDETNRLKHDEERKYGKIPSHIYFLYLKSCGFYTLGIFFMSTFIWQALRIWLDVWLKNWTNENNTSNNNLANVSKMEKEFFLF